MAYVKLSKLLFEGDEQNKPEEPPGPLGIKYQTKHGDPLPHHVTLSMKPNFIDNQKYGELYTVRVNSLFKDNKVAAVSVTLPEGISSENKNPHITVGLFEGGKPFDSNKLDFKKPITALDMDVETKLINATNNSDFAEAYEKEKMPQTGATQLVLTEKSHRDLKAAVNAALAANPNSEPTI